MKVIVTLAKVHTSPHPKAGQPTRFAEMVKTGRKIHTCRDNFPYWKAKLDSLKDNGGTLCVREWTGRPYRSPQGNIIELDANLVEIERLDIHRRERPAAGKKPRYYVPEIHVEDYSFDIDGQSVDEGTARRIAENDGFPTLEEFLTYFDLQFNRAEPDEGNPDVKTLTLALIHFRPFRYGRK